MFKYLETNAFVCNVCGAEITRQTTFESEEFSMLNDNLEKVV
jgi:hypothetical protein